jgi:hypothetical protein
MKEQEKAVVRFTAPELQTKQKNPERKFLHE